VALATFVSLEDTISPQVHLSAVNSLGLVAASNPESDAV